MAANPAPDLFTINLQWDETFGYYDDAAWKYANTQIEPKTLKQYVEFSQDDNPKENLPEEPDFEMWEGNLLVSVTIKYKNDTYEYPIHTKVKIFKDKNKQEITLLDPPTKIVGLVPRVAGAGGGAGGATKMGGGYSTKHKGSRKRKGRKSRKGRRSRSRRH